MDEIELARLQERVAAMQTALTLQAREYERRLTDLNHAHEKAIAVQHTYVTQDKYEDKLTAEADARATALQRVDEKFGDFITRYEARQREVDQKLSIMQGAAEQATRVVDEQARKTNRNLAIAVLVITLAVGLANYIGAL